MGMVTNKNFDCFVYSVFHWHLYIHYFLFYYFFIFAFLFPGSFLTGDEFDLLTLTIVIVSYIAFFLLIIQLEFICLEYHPYDYDYVVLKVDLIWLTPFLFFSPSFRRANKCPMGKSRVIYHGPFFVSPTKKKRDLGLKINEQKESKASSRFTIPHDVQCRSKARQRKEKWELHRHVGRRRRRRRRELNLFITQLDFLFSFYLVCQFSSLYRFG